MIPGSANPLLLASAAQAGGYAIERSLRFNSADSAYLSRTPASTGNRKTWTWAGWVKPSAVGTNNASLFVSGIDSSASTEIRILATSYLNLGHDGVTIGRTNAVLRDLSAWYHVAIAVDSTQATQADRIKMYINGESQSLSISSCALNLDTEINNSAYTHKIGAFSDNDPNYFLNGYLADIHFIDGQALDPTSFGEFDINGIWQPKAFTGSYGTNGFHLTFSDNSTAGSLGDDSSGNGNDWTVNNISVAAGAGNDSVVDVPTNGTETDTGVGGEVRGNYCTWNALDARSIGSSQFQIKNGNLEVFNVAYAYGAVGGTLYVPSGKWYWEVVTTGSVDGIYDYIGVFADNSSRTSAYPSNMTNSYWYRPDGKTVKNLDGNSGVVYGASWQSGDVIGVALDADNKTLTFYKNGVSQGVAFTGLSASASWTPAVGDFSNALTLQSWIANFGQRPFAYTAPNGFKALCTSSLPAPVVTKPSTVMDVKLYTGNGSTQTISGLEFSPDLVWIKNRAQADNHKLLDTVRGATEELESNTTDAEVTNADGLTAFNSNGFDLGADAEYNTNTEAYVAWNWDAGDSTVTNNDGSITSSVRANPSAGFSIVTFSTANPTNETVGHGLGAVPSFIIYKARTVTGSSFYENWNTYHGSLPSSYLQLNTTSTGGMGSPGWGTISSSVFGVTNSFFITGNYVAYCFAPVAGYSAFGSYTGNGSADGPFVFCGFRPRWVLLKNTSQTADWVVVDAARLGYNGANSLLFPNRTLIEAPGDYMDLLSNGFKILSSLVEFNQNTSQYIYAAFAESPFPYARAR